MVDGLIETAQTARGLGLSRPKGKKGKKTTLVGIEIIEKEMTQGRGLSIRVLERVEGIGGHMDPMVTGGMIIVMTVSASDSGITTFLLPGIPLTIFQLLMFGHHRHLDLL